MRESGVGVRGQIDCRQDAQPIGLVNELLCPGLEITNSGDVGDAGNAVDLKWQAGDEVGHEVKLLIVRDSRQLSPTFGNPNGLQPPAHHLHCNTHLQPATDAAVEGDDPGICGRR